MLSYKRDKYYYKNNINIIAVLKLKMERVNQMEKIMKEIEEKAEKATKELILSENGKKFKNKLYQKIYDSQEISNKKTTSDEEFGKNLLEIIQNSANEFQKKTGKQGLTYGEIRSMFG
jgi:hypothetical protein